MKAGERWIPILIERDCGKTPDAAGQPVPDWQPALRTFGTVRQLSGREMVFAEQLQARATHEWKIRFSPCVTELMRVVCQGRKFNIANVNDVGLEHKEMLLTCLENKSPAAAS